MSTYRPRFVLGAGLLALGLVGGCADFTPPTSPAVSSSRPTPRTTVTTSCINPNMLCGSVSYVNFSGNTVPLPGAMVRVNYVDPQYGSIDGGFSSTTDANGYFELIVANSYDYVDGHIVPENPSFSGPFFDVPIGGYAGEPGPIGDMNMGSNNAVRVFANAYKVAESSRVIFGGLTPDHVLVRLENWAPDRASQYSTARWHPPFFGGIIQMNQANYENISNIFHIGHEFGHALQNEALKGYTSCSGNHYFDTVQSRECAYSEGFAHFHAFVTLQDVLNTSLPEDNSYFYASQHDGTVIEGAVLAFLWDITDAANEPGDATSYPASFVAQVMKNCQVVRANYVTYTGPKTVEELVDCLEGSVDADFARAISVTPLLAVSTNVARPAGWSAQAVKTTAFHDLVH